MKKVIGMNAKEYYQAHKDHIKERYNYLHREIVTDYTHDCGKRFDNATQAWVHMQMDSCESIVYLYFPKK